MKYVIVECDPETGKASMRTTPISATSATTIVQRVPQPVALSPIVDPGSALLTLESIGVEISPGELCWKVFRQEPGAEFRLHHTDSVDLDVVVSGSVTLGTGEESVELGVGDCAMIVGAPHSWSPGPDGCLLSVTFVGAVRRT